MRDLGTVLGPMATIRMMIAHNEKNQKQTSTIGIARSNKTIMNSPITGGEQVQVLAVCKNSQALSSKMQQVTNHRSLIEEAQLCKS